LVTVAPYMGKDSVEPFCLWKNILMLALTSNEGALTFKRCCRRKELYKQVLETSKTWKNRENWCVVGATKAEFPEIRKIVPDSFLLVPG
jgi:orotidine-5'-phosphate decarboxylase